MKGLMPRCNIKTNQKCDDGFCAENEYKSSAVRGLDSKIIHELRWTFNKQYDPTKSEVKSKVKMLKIINLLLLNL